MREADLRGANLSNSNLAGALLEFADLRNANMDGANLDGAALDYAYLHGAKVGNSSSSVFARADFQSILDSESAGVKNVFDLAAAPARTVEVNGHKVRHLAYENPIHSKAPETTIFLHGLAAFSGTWLLMMPSLSKHLRMVVPDMIGFGYSDKPRVSYDLDFFMEFITGMLDTLSLDRVNLVGMSFGARLAAEFAIRFPGRLGKLVLCSPVFIPRFFNAALFSSVVFKMDYKGFFQTFVDGNYFEKDPDAGQVIETSSKIFAEMIKQPDLQYSYQSALSHLAKYPQLKGRLKAISAPTLVVWGEKDRISSVSKADQFGEIPDVRLVTLEDCGHYVCLQRPVEFSREILKFL